MFCCSLTLHHLCWFWQKPKIITKLGSGIMRTLYNECQALARTLALQCESVVFNTHLCKFLTSTYVRVLDDLDEYLQKEPLDIVSARRLFLEEAAGSYGLHNYSPQGLGDVGSLIMEENIPVEPANYSEQEVTETGFCRCDTVIDARTYCLCETALQELRRVMLNGKRLVTSWKDKDWWRSVINSSDSLSVHMRVILHLKEFLNCIKVLKIAIAEARCDATFVLSTNIEDYDIWMSNGEWNIATVEAQHSGTFEDDFLMSSVDKAATEDIVSLLSHLEEGQHKFSTCKLANCLQEKFKGGLHSIDFHDVEISIKEFLGGGSYGTVFKCEFLGVRAAAKIFNLLHASRREIENEVNLFATLQHPNVVQFIGYAVSGDQHVLVSELMDMDLQHYLQKSAEKKGGYPLPLLIVIDIMGQIAEAMNYLHQNGVIHRDLKSSNVLINVEESDTLSSSVHVKLTDFGQSKLKDSSKFTTKQMGTTPWRAPEVFEDNKNTEYTKAADVYSFAMVFFEVLTGKCPFDDQQRLEIHETILCGMRPWLPSKAYCPVHLSTFIDRCWATAAEDRPQFSEICQMLVYCKGTLLRHSYPCPLKHINEYDAKQLLASLGLKRCVQEGVSENLPMEVYSIIVSDACKDQKHMEHMKGIVWIREQVKVGKYFADWNNQWQDLEMAVKLFSTAAKSGNPEALCRLGLCFECGLGTTQNIEKAVEVYKKATDHGYACAYVGLGCCCALTDAPQNATKMLEKAYKKQNKVGKPLPCIAEMLHCLSKLQNSTAAWANEGCRKLAQRYLLIESFPAGRKLIADAYISPFSKFVADFVGPS